MQTYIPSGVIGTLEAGGEDVSYEWWHATENLSPLPDAEPPRFARRLDWQSHKDGGWLAVGQTSRYGPCGYCLTSPCIPQCPRQTKPAPTPTFWQERWARTAAEMIAHGETVNPLYAPTEQDARKEQQG